ncbi:MAG: hypothetical protein AMDU4_FER2C00028G0003 [Ferroplasma sp. Type II]|jgi:hypothetical protein|uniref:hypothetical protein n=1 Tax=Ferroplasma sp. Type II TaxID=261388 RepID=UPI000389593E|nr:hypothetical protein [Ferroplasma sp. Type II]EQB74096.1 MAG: hypothetical protein AMDU4_FER2C00028G0003 [Ferroplasma sp. Type II]HIH60854.1 hypothetical protein [Ferroplasma sp.]HII82101.1 hypothetical protein [Ferroplasma sp.]
MSYLDCFKNITDADQAAEAIHCIQKCGETVLYDDTEKRLILWREIYDKSPEEHMIKISKLLEISSRETYEAADKRYNLTMY